MGKIPIFRISIILEKGNKALICLLLSSFFASKILRVFNLNFIEKVSRKKFWHSTDAENNSSFLVFLVFCKRYLSLHLEKTTPKFSASCKNQKLSSKYFELIFYKRNLNLNFDN